MISPDTVPRCLDKFYDFLHACVWHKHVQRYIKLVTPMSKCYQTPKITLLLHSRFHFTKCWPLGANQLPRWRNRGKGNRHDPIPRGEYLSHVKLFAWGSLRAPTAPDYISHFCPLPCCRVPLVRLDLTAVFHHQCLAILAAWDTDKDTLNPL